MPRFTENGVTIDYAVAGPDDGVPLLLIMGLGMQGIAWPRALVERFVAQGFRVITFDNRDVGLSTRYDDEPMPGWASIFLARLLGRRLALPYGLADLADDAARLLAHLHVDRAHVAGMSMGGMIAMHLAARHPARVASLTLMSTSTGRLGLPPPRPRVMRVALTKPGPRSGVDEAVAYSTRMFTAIGSPAYPTPPDEMVRRARVHAERAPRGTGVMRQLAALTVDGDRRPLLGKLAVRTLILHGADD
ncbi:MAG TPA: alpha/beta hydrolase, partial [Xanthomonadales bacterium]|nr:alpha/beta hydrolase [Xanthomonadales bacterium]